MKNYLTQKKRLLPLLSCLFWLLAFTNLNAQITLTWDKESGCQVYKPGERKDFQEDIGPGSCVRVCENSVVNYFVSNPNNWPAVWTVTGGAINSQNNATCSVSWGSSGWGFVSVTVTTPNGPRTEEMCLEIIDGPNAQFTMFPYSPDVIAYEACLEQELYFTNLSTDGGGSELVSYFWDFGDGNYSSEFEPTHTYNQPGTFTIRLTVTNACNCTHVMRKRIRINDVKSFDITCNSVVCENGSDTYSVPPDIAKACGSKFNWKVEGGTITSPTPYGPSINVTWDHVDETGFGYVTFDAKDCGFPCSAVTIKVPVVLSEGKIVGDAVVCANDQYRYKLPQWPTTDFIWSVVDNGTGASIINTDQRNEVIVQTGSAGDITLRCTYNNTMLKCGGYAEYTIRVRPMGVINGPKELCQNSNASYNIVGGFTANWTLKRPNNTIATGTGTTFTSLFSIPGKYTLTVTGNDFCQPEQPFVIRVDKIPATPLVADIVGPDKICVNTPYEYSMVNTEPGTILVWEPVNGTISGSPYGQEVTVEFSGAGPFGIKVRRENAISPHCTSPQVTKTVVKHNPVVVVSGPVNNICPSSVTSYSTAYLEGETYEWTVTPNGAGSISAGQGTASASVQWNNTPIPGTTVNVRVRKCAVYYNASLAVTVTPIPVLSINGVPASICPNQSVSVSLGSSPALASGTVIWDFGDGSSTVTLPHNMNPLPHYYSNPTSNTSYTITATVLSPNGCLSPLTVTKTFTVMPAPVAYISPDVNRVFCSTVTPFTLTATVNLPFSSIQWRKNGVDIPGANSLSYTITSFGSYNAYVVNANGCGSYTNTVRAINNCGPGCTITPAPTVTLNATQTSCDTYTATAFTSPAPVSHSWEIGQDAGFSGTPTATNANIVYSHAGQHVIIYNATYPLPGGGLCTVQRYVTKIIPFIPEIKYDVVCSATPGMWDIVIKDFSEYYPGAPADTKTFTVNGNNYPVPVGQMTHTVTVPGGSYNLGIVLTKAGYQTCTFNLSSPVVLPTIAPVTIAGPTAACNGTGFNFSSNLTPQPGLFFFWNFGDGTFNANPTPTKIYSTPGTYTVTLSVTTLFGCGVTDTHTVVVHPNGLGGNLTSNSPNCEGDPIILTFNNTGPGPNATPTSYTWMKDTAVVGSTTTPTFAVNESGAYWVTLTNSNGCIKHLDTANAKFIMTPDPVISGPDAVCVNAPFTLSGYAGAGLQYRWLRNNVQIAPWSSSYTLNYTSTIVGAANYTVEVRVSDGAGGYCVGSASYAVTTYANPPVPSISFDVPICDPYTVKLSAYTGTPGTFTWSNGMSGPDITVNAGGPYMVTFTNPGGCTTTAQIDVPKDPEVYFWIFPTGCYDFCFTRESGPFEILGPSPFISFNKWFWWKDLNIEQAGNGVVPNYTVSQSGEYQMGLNNGYCHKDTGIMDVNITECKCDIKYEVREVRTDYKPFCHYLFVMFIDNPYSYPITVNVSSDAGMGIFQPGAVTVPPGGANFPMKFIPINFSGGTLVITLTTTNEKGDICKGMNKWTFPQCRASRDAGDDDQFDGLTKKGIGLIVSPNPAHDVTALDYTFASANSQSRTIEIYSLMGVLLEKHDPENQTGTWNIDLGKYAAGQYIAVMREDGVAVAQKAIIIQ